MFDDIEFEDEECRDTLIMDDDNQPSMELPVLDRYDDNFVSENRNSWLAYDEIDLNEQTSADCVGASDLAEDIESGAAVDPRAKADNLLKILEGTNTTQRKRLRLIALAVLALVLVFCITVIGLLAHSFTSTTAPSPLPEEMPAATVDHQTMNEPITSATSEDLIQVGIPAARPTTRSSSTIGGQIELPQLSSESEDELLIQEGIQFSSPPGTGPTARSSGAIGQIESPLPSSESEDELLKQEGIPFSSPLGTGPTARSSNTIESIRPPQPIQSAMPNSFRFVDGNWVPVH